MGDGSAPNAGERMIGKRLQWSTAAGVAKRAIHSTTDGLRLTLVDYSVRKNSLLLVAIGVHFYVTQAPASLALWL